MSITSLSFSSTAPANTIRMDSNSMRSFHTRFIIINYFIVLYFNYDLVSITITNFRFSYIFSMAISKLFTFLSFRHVLSYIFWNFLTSPKGTNLIPL